MTNTKTVATVGPACNRPEILSQMVDAGIDLLRLNFSHGTLEEHTEVLEMIHDLRQHREIPLGVMGDLCGPKIRTGQVDEKGIFLRPGDALTIHKEPILGRHHDLSVTLPEFLGEIEVGDRVMIDDGKIKLVVEEKTPSSIICRCQHGGVIGSRKGINLPDTAFHQVPALTEKDLQDLDWAIKHQLEYVALSFVRNAGHIQSLRRILQEHSSDIAIIAKIEKPQALEHLDALIDVSDGILVARGDLGVEMELYRLPALQKDITMRCQTKGKPVLIATQMLHSMLTSPTPSRAEVSDVANAVLDFADAIMLSAESAIGEYPVQSVHTMNEIARHTESFQHRSRQPLHGIHREGLPVISSLAQCAKALAEQLQPALLAVWTKSGTTARVLSKHRFTQPIIALTDNERAYHQLCLYYGVIPCKVSCPDNLQEMLAMLEQILSSRKWAHKGDTVIVIAGTEFAITGGNNSLLIHQL